MAAILAYHASLRGQSVGRHLLVTCFLRGALWLRPPVQSRIPPWDLAVVLEALCRPPFEPIEEISDRHLTLKTVFLLAITYLKRVGYLQALSVAPTHLDFAPGMAKAFLYPRAGYVPKGPSFTPQPVVLQAFSPPPFREPDQQKLNCMCPVRALDTYVHRAVLWRKGDQLLVCYGPPKRGLPASKQILSRWIVDAINIAYESSDLPSLMGVKAHSTRSVAASKAFLPYTGHLQRCGMVYAPDLYQVLRPGHAGHPRLFRPLALDVLHRDTHWAGTWMSGGVGI